MIMVDTINPSQQRKAEGEEDSEEPESLENSNAPKKIGTIRRTTVP